MVTGKVTSIADMVNTEIIAIVDNFDLFYSKLFDGVRQDSGSPIEFIYKTIRHYKNKGIIMPNGVIPKTIVFSDSIDSITKIEEIEYTIDGRILSSYGIGTWMSNDVIIINSSDIDMEIRKAKSLNMVIKMSEAKPDGMGWKNCVKLSDSKGKHTGNKRTVELYKEELGI